MTASPLPSGSYSISPSEPACYQLTLTRGRSFGLCLFNPGPSTSAIVSIPAHLSVSTPVTSPSNLTSNRACTASDVLHYFLFLDDRPMSAMFHTSPSTKTLRHLTTSRKTTGPRSDRYRYCTCRSTRGGMIGGKMCGAYVATRFLLYQYRNAILCSLMM